jgi:SagB-type dehydrogenase family enzyme
MQWGRTGTVRLALPERTLRFRPFSKGIDRVLRVLADGGATASKLSDLVRELDGAAGLPPWYYCLDSLQLCGALCSILRRGELTIARLRPASLSPPPVKVSSRFLLSRMAYIRREQESFVLHAPVCGARLELTDSRALSMVAALSHPTSVPEVAAAAQDIDDATVGAFLSLLQGAGMLEDRAQDSGDWGFGDLVLHASSRNGNARTVTAADRPRAPALKPDMSKAVIQLYRPDLKDLKTHDVPLTEVLESRRSVRSYAPVPLTSRQVGEFLFRVARVKRVTKTTAGQFTRRLYPSGGACYGLEVYPIIERCRGAAPGMYHYDPMRHRLEALTANRSELQALLRRASRAAGGSTTPQILFVITARFPRVQWKYGSMAYALVLKEVGALYQTMYLVATAMGLGPCALGGGDPDLCSRLIGTDFNEETSVGEFLLGSRAHDEQA